MATPHAGGLHVALCMHGSDWPRYGRGSGDGVCRLGGDLQPWKEPKLPNE